MKRLALLATILMVASACDKTRSLARGQGPEVMEPAPPERFAVERRPDVLFQVFGERDDLRMIPVAALDKGTLQPINLGSSGWRVFDSLYTRSGTSVTIYHDGRPSGRATVKQGMWEKADAPLYTLPGCRLLTPLAAVTISGAPVDGYTVEYLATTASLPARAPAPLLSSAETARLGRALAHQVAKTAELSPARLDSLDFYATSVATGATESPTLIASIIDPGASGDTATAANTAHVFLIADRIGNEWRATYSLTVNGDARRAEYRRYLDHLDLDGDGVDEMILEGWTYGADTQLLVLRWHKDVQKWVEDFKARSSWCIQRG